MKTKWFDTGPLPLFLGFTISDCAYKASMRKMGVDGPPKFVTEGAFATTHTFRHPRSGHCAIVCVDRNRCRGASKDGMAGLIAHEAMHVWTHLLEFMGETKPGDEIGAYTLQWMTSTLMGEYYRQVKSQRSEAAMAKKPTTKKAKSAKVKKVMGEYKSGSLKSSSGQKVKNRKQAVAIAMSEAGIKPKKSKSKGKR